MASDRMKAVLAGEPELRRLFGKLRAGKESEAMRLLSDTLAAAYDAGRKHGQCPYAHVSCITHGKPLRYHRKDNPWGSSIVYDGCDECIAVARIEALTGESMEDTDAE